MIIVDAHCDTVTKIMEHKEDLLKNRCHIDLERMQNGNSYVQFFAAFIAPEYCQAYAMKRALQVIDKLYSQVAANEDKIMLCFNGNDIKTAVGQNKVAALLSIEGGEALQGDLAALRMFYKLGVRSLCLTWNHRNEIADGVADGASGGGLTPFGRAVVEEMNLLGMMIDVSHLSEKGFWDVIELSKHPVIASHSNAKKICSHRRNLTDEQITAMMKNRGVMGINLYPDFLNDTGKASIKDVITHIEHVTGLVGVDHIGLGADFDGIDSVPDGINGIQDVYLIFDELLRLNYPEESVEKFAGGNFLRVIEEVL